MGDCTSDASYHEVARLSAAGHTLAVATVVRTRGSVPRRAGARMVVRLDGTFSGTVGGGEMEARVIREARALLDSPEHTRFLSFRFEDPAKGDVGVCGGQVEVYVEAVRPREKLVVVGGGHVGKAVAHLGGWLGLEVVVCDDRPAFASEEEVPGADAYLVCPLAELPARVQLDARTYVVLTTRGVDVDVAGLPSVLDSAAAYVGVIGSRRRAATLRRKLVEAGVSDDRLARLTSPIGLDLRTETPEEIALSVLAQILAVRRGGARPPATGESGGQ